MKNLVITLIIYYLSYEMNTYNELINNEFYKTLLEQLSETERKEIENNLKELLDKFDNSLTNMVNKSGK